MLSKWVSEAVVGRVCSRALHLCSHSLPSRLQWDQEIGEETFLGSRAFWTSLDFPWGKRIMKLQTSLYLGRNNYPVRPKSAQIFFFSWGKNVQRITLVFSFSFSDSGKKKKVTSSKKNVFSSLPNWFPLVKNLPQVPRWCLDSGNKWETERVFVDKLLLLGSGLSTSCLNCHHAPNKSPGILFLKTNLRLSHSCLVFLFWKKKIQTLYD